MASKARILVVDDEQRVRTLCREVLELQDYSVTEASNGAQALDILKDHSFSLILSDIMMPDIDGLELASIIRKEYPDTFTILITGHGSINIAKDAIQRGAFDFVTKPFKMAELNQTVERALEVRKQQLSVLPSPELKDLYEITVNTGIMEKSIQDYLKGLADSLKKTFRGDLSRVYLTDRPGGLSLTRMAGSGEEELLDENSWETASKAALGRRSGFLVGRDCQHNLPENSKVSSLMAYPIPSQEGNLGICMVGRSKIPSSFTTRDLKLMGLFAAQTGNQLMNYRMASNLKEQAEYLEQVNILAGEFSSSLDTGQVLTSISRGLKTLVSFDLFGVFLSGKDMIPLSYMLVRSDIPDEVLNRDFREALEESQDDADVNLFLESGIRDSFASSRVADWNSPPVVETLDLGEFGTFKGMIVLARWSAEDTAVDLPSYIPILLRHAAAALSNAYLFETSERNYIQAISALASAVDAKDPYTHNHSRNVAAYVTKIASHMKLPSREISLLNNAALLHDIGKIGVPETILNKESALTTEEWELIRTHPEVGYNILRPVTAFGSFIKAVRFHHERFDGKGYPAGLEGRDIPFHARVLAVADCFDAMTSDRVYRKSPGLDYAIKEIRNNSGTQFDPEISDVFLSILETMSPEQIIDEYLSRGSNQVTFS
ncbi:MAG: response regulator [Candidatus Aegiribacteria sp.]|nr:response regulator [Candidatus Aegiribacteria sp.]MBD3294748.1 response regulator [Candidatus Fermentibacteria bacterium]